MNVALLLYSVMILYVVYTVRPNAWMNVALLLYCYDIVVWRHNTSARCQLSDDHSSIQLTHTTTTTTTTATHDTAGDAGPEAGTDATSEGVLCMSDGASVQCGHSVSFLIQHSQLDDDAGPSDVGPEAGRVLMLSERDGVGLSVSDDININSDDVIFYSFHGT